MLLLSGISSSFLAQDKKNETPVAGPLNLDQVVTLALKNYPQIRAASAQAAAAAAGVGLARTAFLPRTELVWQANRATRNNVFGQFFPGSVPLPISGPVLGTNSGTSVWGTAAGFLFGWEPFDFGARGARVAIERARQGQAAAQLAATELETASTAADAFLTLMATRQSVVAARAGVERAQVLVKSVEALVKSKLRPGADAASAQAELASAQNQLIQAEQAETLQRVQLSNSIGLTGQQVEIQPEGLAEVVPSPTLTPFAPLPHPFLQVQAAALDIARARRRELDKVYFPRFDFQAASYGRGTGALTDGSTLGGFNGLAPNTINWAVGLTARFQLFDLPAVRQRRLIEEQNQNAEMAKRDQMLQDLSAQEEKARINLDAAQRIAQNTPVQLRSAQTAEQQVKARYQAGLTTLVELADVQRLLTQSETEDSIARLRVWRALLAVSVAQGDLRLFLDEVRRHRELHK